MSVKSKKIAQWILAIITLCIATLFIAPFLFQENVKKAVTDKINDQIEATVSFEKFGLSFFRHFPNASATLQGLHIVGKGDFANDTLLATQEVVLTINLKSLFSKEGFEIQKIGVSDAQIFAHILPDGRANWDIIPTDTTQTNDTTSSSLRLQLKDITIDNAQLTYQDETSEMMVKMKQLNAKLKGDFTDQHTTLDTHISINSINGWSGKTKLLQDVALLFDATIDAQLDKQRYELKDNKLLINQMPLSINGWTALQDEGMEMDMKLQTDQIDFKSILSLVPAIYAKDFEQLQADGNVTMSGFAKGEMKGENYPAFALQLNVSDAWFKYPNLPQSVTNITLLGKIENKGGELDNTIIDLSQLSMHIGEQPIATKIRITKPLSDPYVEAILNGNINLATIEKIYPLEKEIKLDGQITMNLNGKAKKSDIDKQQYDNIRFAGQLDATNIRIETPQLPQRIAIDNTQLKFDDHALNLNRATLHIGENNISIQGKITNYLGYALNNTPLTGQLNFTSSYLNVSDLMSNSPTDKKSENDTLQAISIPTNINFTLIGKCDKLVYQKMNFENANARLDISDGQLHINQLHLDAFEGNMALTGKYATQEEKKPTIDFDIQLHDVSFASLFEQVEMVQTVAPILDNITGKLNANLSLNTTLQQNMMPILSSILSSGSLQTKSVGIEKIAVLDQLAQQLQLTQTDTWRQVKDIALKFAIKEGKISTQPFDLNVGDYKLQLGGTTGLDKSIDYKGDITLPKNINLGEFQTIGFLIGGTFDQPSIQLDVANTLTNIIEGEKEKITKQVEKEKNRLINKGNEKREQALQQANKKAKQLLTEAENSGKKLIEIARTQGDSIIAKTNNPITKAIAQKAADELVKQAQKKADDLYQKAEKQADEIIKKADKQTQF